MRMRTRIATLLAFIFIALGLLIIILSATNKEFNDWSFVLNRKIASDFGSFIGGVVGPLFSISAFLLVYATFVEQRKTFQLQKFEGRLFELLRYHRENVSLMKLRVPSQKDMTVEGYRCFIEMKKQFEEIYQIVKEVDFENTFEEKIKIKLAYSILFYGVGANSMRTLNNETKDIDNHLALLVTEKCKVRKTEYDKNTVYFGGNQSRLGHYFRNISQIVQYIDEADFLTDKDKYEYVKLLRTQLSQYEIAIFFLNTFSERGKSWKQKGWINRYKMIKNIPENFIGEINPKEYFSMKFEYEE
jgi:hypothetical protein